MRISNYMPRAYVLLWVLNFCFVLSAQETKSLFILHTNDTHSRIEPCGNEIVPQEYADKGGYLRRSAFIKEMRQAHSDLLLFDCGDFSQGTPYYNIFRGEVEIKLMNHMGYDAGIIGNHEFDFGLDNMLRLFKLANFPIVCANYDFTGTVLEGIVKPYTIIRKNGLKIGVFGLSPRMEGLVQAKNFEGVVYKDPVEEANKVAEYLKIDEKCDLVICLSHLGWKSGINNPASDEYLIPRTRHIDVVLGGHSHTFFEKTLFYKNLDGEDVPLQQMGKNGIYVGTMELKFSKE